MGRNEDFLGWAQQGTCRSLPDTFSGNLSVSSPSVKATRSGHSGSQAKVEKVPGSARLSLVNVEIRDGNDPVFVPCYGYAL